MAEPTFGIEPAHVFALLIIVIGLGIGFAKWIFTKISHECSEIEVIKNDIKWIKEHVGHG